MSATSIMTNIPISISSGNVETYNCDINDSDFFDNLLLLFGDKKFSDITLIDGSGETQVSAHRLILTARSKYFAAMFNGSFKEADSREVKFEDIDGKTLQMVISFLYSNTIDLEGDTVENVMKAAHLLEIKPLEVVCCDYLRKKIETSNVLGVLLYADQYNITTLSEYASEFAVDRFMELRHHEEFFSLDVQQLSNLITSDDLRVCSENDVFHSILEWVQHDREGREQFFEDLFQHLRLTLLSPKFIARTVQPVIKSSKCKELIFNAYQWHLLPDLRESLVPKPQIQRRIVDDVLIAIDGWGNDETNLRVAIYTPSLKEWSYKECPRPLARRTALGFTTLNDKLYIAGGLMANRRALNSVDCLDLKTLQWTQLPSMLTARSNCGMTTLNGKLYVVGGKQRHGFSGVALKSVEKWDPLTGAWDYITPMRNPVGGPIVGVKGSSLCVARDKHNGERILDIYDPLTKEWTCEWSHAPEDLLGMGTVPINRVDHFLTIAKSEIKVYNLKNNNIKIIPVNYEENVYISNFALLNNGFIIKTQSELKKYCLIEDEWESISSFCGGSSNQLILVSQRM